MTGEVTVEHSAAPIYSIDVQLLRVESVASGDKMATETSEIQSTQASSSLLWTTKWRVQLHSTFCISGMRLSSNLLHLCIYTRSNYLVCILT